MTRAVFVTPARGDLHDDHHPRRTLGGAMNTRTIAIAALVIVVIVVLILVL